jgi:hypothetical protein
MQPSAAEASAAEANGAAAGATGRGTTGRGTGGKESARRKSTGLPIDRHVEQQLDRVAGVAPAKRVEVSLGEIAPVLADAIQQQRGWLNDFANDTVSIDADLYEVLLAYQKMRRLNAA